MTKLTLEQHAQLAALLNEVQKNLDRACRIVKRAPYTDQRLRIGGAIQELLIDPLREAWDAEDWYRSHENPYPSVGYGGPARKRFMRQMKGDNTEVINLKE